jgi:tight adherence protein B
MAWLPVVCLVSGAVALVWPDRTVLRSASFPAIRRTISTGRPERMLGPGVAAAALLGFVLGGPVAGVAGAVYAWLGGRSLIRRAGRGRAAARRATELDELVALAADLRAGLPPAALAGASRVRGSSTGLLDAVWRLAERTGAPAADLVERIEADARSADRAAASAAAQAAGAQATAALLAGLPLAGIGLGVAIGADPVAVLLHTPVGAACGVAAVLLQSGGLLWAERLAAPGTAR